MSDECYSVSRGNELALTGNRRGDRMPKNLKLKAARAEKDMTQGALAEARSKRASTTPPSIFAAASAKFWEKHWMNCSGRNEK